jgi:pyruvate,water dikinase
MIPICGQAPGDHAEFTALLVDQNIDAMPLNPDSVIETKRRVGEQETSWCS